MTGTSPAELLFGRKLGTLFPSFRPSIPDDSVRTRDHIAKKNMKNLAGDHGKQRPHPFQLGDIVLVGQKRKTKLTPSYQPIPHKIIATDGSIITAQANRRTVTRNYSFFKPFKITREQGEERNDTDDDTEPIQPTRDNNNQERRYPTRENRNQVPRYK